MSRNVSKRLSKLERVLGTDGKTRTNLVELERAVLFRTRLEGASVWFEAGGHVLYPLNHPRTRKAFCAMLEAQDRRIERLVRESLDYCLEHDPYQLDANYPLLEYYLWTVLYISVNDQPFRPMALPVELCDWVLGIKPEESIHYRPRDWCWVCGYRYPALYCGVGHDLEAFLLTRYSKEQIGAMAAPFRGKACLLCGGEIMNCHGMDSKAKDDPSQQHKSWEHSPAARLCESKRDDWNAEIDALALPPFFDYGYLDEKALETAAKKNFYERRSKQKSIREEHRPSVQEMSGRRLA
jgi:hypothetical protein